MKLILQSDGGALSNPGPAAWAYHIDTEDGKAVAEGNKAFGNASNNVAEYLGLINGLTKVEELLKTPEYQDVTQIQVYADSELMIKQINGLYKVKHADMRDLYMQIKMLEGQIGIQITYTHVLRHKNARADALVKQALGR